jgi:hypothetical protein
MRNPHRQTRDHDSQSNMMEVLSMRGLKYALLAASAFLLFSLPAQKAEAQISVGIGIGAEPACPYGYYGYAPYNCAPYGYYGPEWFNGGVFIGAGRWFHGPAHVYGHVNRSFDPRYGYHGAYPEHGGWHEPPDHFQSFHASHMADPHGGYHGHPR